MFERFTDSAREVVVRAQDEARALRHNYIGTEHLLLGLLRQQEGAAARVLERLDLTHQEARVKVARMIGEGETAVPGQIPFTPRGKKVLEHSLREAKALGNDYIGPEHILLGLARENQGVAARILLDHGADADTIRDAVGGEPPDEPLWIRPRHDVPFVGMTVSSNGGCARLFGLWPTANAALLAAAVLVGVGLLIGWLICG